MGSTCRRYLYEYIHWYHFHTSKLDTRTMDRHSTSISTSLPPDTPSSITSAPKSSTKTWCRTDGQSPQGTPPYQREQDQDQQMQNVSASHHTCWSHECTWNANHMGGIPLPSWWQTVNHTTLAIPTKTGPQHCQTFLNSLCDPSTLALHQLLGAWKTTTHSDRWNAYFDPNLQLVLIRENNTWAHYAPTIKHLHHWHISRYDTILDDTLPQLLSDLQPLDIINITASRYTVSSPNLILQQLPQVNPPTTWAVSYTHLTLPTIA